MQESYLSILLRWHIQFYSVYVQFPFLCCVIVTCYHADANTLTFLYRPPADAVKPLYLQYAKLEEDNGLAKRAMTVYNRATKAVPS